MQMYNLVLHLETNNTINSTKFVLFCISRKTSYFCGCRSRYIKLAMGKHVILTDKQLADFKQMAINGVMPADLARFFGIAISCAIPVTK